MDGSATVDLGGDSTFGTDLFLGYGVGGEAICKLNAGQITAPNIVVGNHGTASVRWSDYVGTVSLNTDTLYLGKEADGSGSLLLERVVTSPAFNLVVGEAVQFDFFECAQRREDKVGQVIEDYAAQLSPVTQLETVLEGPGGEAIPVTLEILVTEVGTLEIWCRARDDQRRWRLEFNVREQKD